MDDVVAEALRHVVMWLSVRLLGLLLSVWSLRVCVCHIYNIQHTAWATPSPVSGPGTGITGGGSEYAALLAHAG